MIRKIIHIDEEKCNGCGLCASACHEGAIDIVDGKAKLVRENFCDGFGDCLPNCPTGAISFEEREAPAYDEAAVKAAQKKKAVETLLHEMHVGGSCPGSRMMELHKEDIAQDQETTQIRAHSVSRLNQWPCQIKLLPTQAPIVRMEVPCCGGLQREAETALRNSGKFIPWQVVTISRDGKILE